jgi:hypothetical protein
MLRRLGLGFNRRFRGGWATILALAIIFTVSGLGSANGSSAAAEFPTSPSGQAKVFAGPRQGFKIAPRRIGLTGLEGRPIRVSGIGWSSWGGTKAKGHGKVSTVGCGSNCTGAVRVVLVKLNWSCGRLAYRKAFLFRGREGQYFPIACGSRSR